MLNSTERAILLKIARAAIESSVLGRPIPQIEAESPGLSQCSGAFVSIHMNGRLRGCIGSFASPNPLYKTVFEMAVAAATQDPRFQPLKEDELGSTKLEISVLSPLREIKEISEIEIGRHGLFLVKGQKRGVLLPQVAIENDLDAKEFIEQTCLKAGLDPDEWRQGAQISIFEAEIIKEG